MHEGGLKDELGCSGQGEWGDQGNSVCKAAGGRERVGVSGDGEEAGGTGARGCTSQVSQGQGPGLLGHCQDVGLQSECLPWGEGRGVDVCLASHCEWAMGDGWV